MPRRRLRDFRASGAELENPASSTPNPSTFGPGSEPFFQYFRKKAQRGRRSVERRPRRKRCTGVALLLVAEHFLHGKGRGPRENRLADRAFQDVAENIADSPAGVALARRCSLPGRGRVGSAEQTAQDVTQAATARATGGPSGHAAQQATEQIVQPDVAAATA